MRYKNKGMTIVQKVRSNTAKSEIYRISRLLEPLIAYQFYKSAMAARKQTDLNELSQAIDKKDTNKILDIIGLGVIARYLMGAGNKPGEKSFQEELFNAYREGSVMGMKQMPKDLALQASFDLTNSASVKYLKDYIPKKITEIIDSQAAAVKAALERGFKEGRPVIAIARDVRNVVGLTDKQAQYVINFQRQLETGEMAGQTAPWARRLSASEQNQAYSEFISDDTNMARVQSLTDRYQESLVNRRSQDIARTEVHNASIQGQSDLWDQAVEDGLIDPDTTKRVWIYTHDARVRDEHIEVADMNSDGVGLNEPFQTPIGPVMNPGMSGDAGFDINCRCAVALDFGGSM